MGPRWHVCGALLFVVGCAEGGEDGGAGGGGGGAQAPATNGASTSTTASSTGAATVGASSTSAAATAGTSTGGPPVETCGNGLDDDGAGGTDCEDPACLGDPACHHASLCAAAIPFAAVPGMASVSLGFGWQGSSEFAGSCVGGSLGQEMVFAASPPKSGVMSVAANSTDDLGFYVRLDCEDASTEIACVDDTTTGTDAAYFALRGGETAYAFVDAAFAGGSGATWTVTLDFVDASEVEPNDDAADATGPASDHTGTIAPAGDVDVFEIALPSGGDLALAVTGWGSDACDDGVMDPALELLGPDGTTVIAASDDAPGSACPTLDVAGLGPGTYFARVSAGAAAPTGARFAYALQIAP